MQAPSPVPISVTVASAIEMACGGESSPSVAPVTAAASQPTGLGSGRAMATSTPSDRRVGEQDLAGRRLADCQHDGPQADDQRRGEDRRGSAPMCASLAGR